MTNTLILGGTGWLSGEIARRWRDGGADVTCLARGGRPAPEGTALVVGDRDAEDPYGILASTDWDEVVDISSRADHVRRAVAALGARAGRWTFVSSLSVYSDDVATGQDETAPLHRPAGTGDVYDYGAEKVAAEEAVRTLGDRARIVRPGLVVGTGDPSDRFGYWAAAFDRAGDDPVLVPAAHGRSAQVIDLGDLAEFIVGGEGTGTVNAIGDARPLAEVLERIRALSSHRGAIVEVPDEELLALGVAHWMGERSLPLWLPADMPGFMTRSNVAYRAAGGRLRPLDETIGDVLADERLRGLDRPRRAGLDRGAERDVLSALRCAGDAPAR
ncbi:nucleoside-diphosphate-sugar epimerase [Microbacterium resistens]|uniref:Nucleoside-diphosphate-sugar epimerase n=1 Tax=Microbacterium resistens TaxID=156977 RepID=A0ABU1S720_9MICO|nr:NAD-dependent epimerase/dehydratase family protein [Microbacterium resistens]MDR6865427.1 nucleoside-diphosphate-sugar epimerase [Microbacterium resistens]